MSHMHRGCMLASSWATHLSPVRVQRSLGVLASQAFVVLNQCGFAASGRKS